MQRYSRVLPICVIAVMTCAVGAPQEVPGPPRRAVDHVVIAVRNLDAAREAYLRLGFQALPKARHIELGSANSVMQLGTTYLELVGDLDKVKPEIGRPVTMRFACGDGLSIVSLTSVSLAAERPVIAAAGLAPSPIVNARRKITLPDGTIDETDSSCFYMWRPGREPASLFLSEHRKPQTIWVKAYQVHPNTVIDVSGLIYVSAEPQSEVAYFAAALGFQPSYQGPDAVAFVGARGERIEILSRTEARRRFGAALGPDCDALPLVGVALSFRVASLATCREVLANSGVSAVDGGTTLVVPGNAACGVLLVLHQ